MSIEVSKNAVVESGAEIGDGCRIGPFCHLGQNVKLGKNNIVHAGAIIDGHTIMGDGNEIFPYACLGTISQDLKYNREWVAYTRIGNGNVFREYASVNASSFEGRSTIIGDDNHMLVYSHVSHDCVLGDRVIIGASSKLAGHVEVENNAIINAMTGILQFVRIGEFSFVGGFNKVTGDVLPYCIAEGSPSTIRAINKVGLERHGFERETIQAIRDAFRTIIRSDLTLSPALEELRNRNGDFPEIRHMIEFAASGTRGLARPKRSSVTE